MVTKIAHNLWKIKVLIRTLWSDHKVTKIEYNPLKYNFSSEQFEMQEFLRKT